LLADLLEISRYDARATIADFAPTDLSALVRQEVSHVRVLAAERGSELVLGAEEPLWADMDARRVSRIVRNLLTNALEHGEGRPVEIELAGDDETVALRVRDHGVGLRPGDSALVFGRFWRGDPSRARRSGGTGLGLAIALEDARLHGGWLQAWGSPGVGAAFRLVLPRRSGGVVRVAPLPLEPAEVGA
jgi:two-component system sensor histidine kinase MtrB